MSKYTMTQIVTLTNINAHTLRKWESRYSFLEPERTDTNIRYYSDEQLKKLLNISILTRNGYRISKIDKMSENEIHDLISNKLIDNNLEDDISALILSTLEMDEEVFDSVLKDHILKKGLLTTMTQLIYPFLNQVGVLWGINKIMPAQEHLTSNLIKKKLLSTIDSLPYPKKSAPSILMFLTENEHHEIALLLAYYIAREFGWRVYYLGQNVPTENIKQVIDETGPKAMMTMFVTPTHIPVETKIDAIIGQSKIPFLVSGNPASLESIIEDKRITYLTHPDDFIKKLKSLT